MIKGNLNKNYYEKIKKLLESEIFEDRDIGYTLLMDKMMELTPKQWNSLEDIMYDKEGTGITSNELQAYWYDKRKKEGESNKRVNSEEGERV